MSFSSSEYSNSSSWPYLRIRYQLGIGELNWYKMETQKLTDRMHLHQNVSTGNLGVHEDLLDIKGTGLDEVFELYYNNLAPDSWDLGRSWIANTGWDVWLEPNVDGVIYFGPGGYAFHFMANGDGSYTSPPGVDATLAHNADGTWSLTFHQSGECYNFSSSGAYLLSDVDKNGNTISFAYDPNGALSSINDTQGRVTTFSYTSGGSSTCGPPTASGFVSAITDPAGRKWQFAYDSNCDLTSITDPAGKVTNFGYDSNTELVQITDPDGNITKLGYDPNYRITSLTGSPTPPRELVSPPTSRTTVTTPW